MKIFHNFDTELKKKDYKGAVSRFGKENVMLIERSGYYWLLRGLVPLLFIAMLWVLLFILFSFLMDMMAPFARFVLILGGLGLIYWMYKILMVYVNYKLDFCIVTYDEIMTHRQKGIFKRNYKNTPAQKIRSVQSAHTGFWGNLLNFGSITFLIDGGTAAVMHDNEPGSGAGKIQLTYVYRPNMNRRKIMLLCVHKESADGAEKKLDEDEKKVEKKVKSNK